MLAGLLLAAAAACPCRKPQDIVIAFDASPKDRLIDDALNAKLTALVEELSGPDSATQIALVAFAGITGECEGDTFPQCAPLLTGLTSDVDTAVITGRDEPADDHKRCTSCGIERAFQLLSASQRQTADATMLLLINGVQNVGGSHLTAANKSAELLVLLHRSPSTPPLNLALTLAGRPHRRIRIWPAGIRAFWRWGLRTAV